MEKHNIVCLPGDGIGKVVLEESVRVLDAAGFEADYVEGDIDMIVPRSELRNKIFQLLSALHSSA